MGRDPLPDATVGTQGCKSTADSKEKDKLRLVTGDNEITVMESRSIGDLGHSVPNSNEFLEYAKVFNNFYGTTRTPVIDKLNKGKNVLFDTQTKIIFYRISKVSSNSSFFQHCANW